MDNVDKAFALARIGLKVFPVASSTRAPLISEKEGGKGFYDGTSDDFEQIATWFTTHPEKTTEVGVWVGGSGLIAADLDRGKKNGKNGFLSLEAADREVSKTENYSTQSGGEHHVYATDRLDLGPGTDVLGMKGVDIRAGASYIVWWGNSVPSSREAFSTDVPEWMIEAALEKPFDGEGFSGTINDWLEAIPDDLVPSGRIRDLMARIPAGEFGHPEMVDLAWSLVRLGSERETGVVTALEKLKEAWLRDPYNTPKFRRDFDLALKGAINKGGRVQNPIPAITGLVVSMKKAVENGVGTELKAMERKVSETDSEIEFARARREMFKAAADAGLDPSYALGVVTGSKAFKNSKASIDSVWFGDGEPSYHDKMDREAEIEEAEREAEQEEIEREIEIAKRATALNADAESFSFLTPAERKLAEGYDWWGKNYLDYVKGRLKHFNKPYHVSAMWATLSVIASPWGKVPLPGSKPTDCNLYLVPVGESTSGKTEALSFGLTMIDAYYGREDGPVIGDLSKLSALALHRQLLDRDEKPSFVYGDEIQSFFQGVGQTQWQNGILGDVSSHYGGEVSPKLTLNDKELSGKRARTMLTMYMTGIADQFLDAINIDHWTNGLFYRFLWAFGEPRMENDDDIEMETASANYTEKFEEWAHSLRVIGEMQLLRNGGESRIVEWEQDALQRMSAFKRQIKGVVKSSSLYDSVFVAANVRFLTSIMKCATLIALSEASEKVKLAHVLVALNFAGPWHRSMVLAVSETGKDSFERDVERALAWIRRNAIRQVGNKPFIQRTMVMREFKPNEVADRLLRQLTEEGWLIRSGDIYHLSEG